MAIGTCAAYGGVPAMRNNPTGAMGLRDYLGWSWTSRLGIPIVNLPGCPVQPNNITETLLALVLQLGGLAPMIDLDDQGRPRWLFDADRPRDLQPRGLRRGRAEFADTLGDDERCLVKLGCKGPVVKCNVPVARLGQRDRRLPERRRHLHRVHRAGVPRSLHAVRGARPPRDARPRAARASPTAPCSATSATGACARRTKSSRPGGGPRPSCTPAMRRRW